MTIRQRRKKLKEMERGTGLSEAYTATLTRLKTQKGNRAALGLKALMWVLYSERPLRAEELCHALGVEIGSTEPDQENIPAIRTLMESCLGLLTVEASSPTVRLVHFTLQEHLSSDPTLFYSPDSTIAEVCLVYLNFGSVRNLSPTLGTLPSTIPLLEYASLYWGEHARRGMTENIKRLALRLLDKFDQHISTKLLLSHYNEEGLYPYYSLHGPNPIGFTGLHGASSLGITEIVAALLEMKEWDVNATDSDERTALAWAARRGHEEVVRMLLERGGVNLHHVSTNNERTPLLLAAQGGHEGIVKMLLEREDVNLNRADKFGDTPLGWAAEGGHEGTVKMFLEREEVNPDHEDTGVLQTPLSRAARRGHEGVVKMLLEREEVNPDRVDGWHRRTPLSWAAANGHVGIVKMLLEREEVNPDYVDTRYGRTPLFWAASSGRAGIVKMLLEREDVNPNRVDKFGNTPLSRAAVQRHEDVVNILSNAARRGHDRVSRMLFDQSNFHPVLPDSQNKASPSLSRPKGHNPVSSTLLERDNLSSDRSSQDFHEHPPTSSRHDQFVEEIPFTPHDLNPDITGSHGQPQLLSPDHNAQPRLLDPQVSVPNSTHSGHPPQPPWWSQPLSTGPLKLCFSRRKTRTHPNNT